VPDERGDRHRLLVRERSQAAEGVGVQADGNARRLALISPALALAARRGCAMANTVKRHGRSSPSSARRRRFGGAIGLVGAWVFAAMKASALARVT
jgi:hypothetical protein